MLTFLGILLLVAIGAAYLGNAFLKHPPSFVTSFVTDKKKVILAAGVAVFMIVFNGLFFFAKPGTAYAVQYWWGGDRAVTSQGVAFNGFSPNIPFSFEIAIQDTIGTHEAQDEIYYRSAVERELSGSVRARVAASVIVSVNYQNEEMFLSMADKNRNEAKLVHARIIPAYDQALKNSCKLITAQEYIDGASSQFDFYLKDQLQHGMYITQEVWEEQELTQISDTVSRTVKSKAANIQKQKRYVIRKDKLGNPLRDTTNSLARYGLTVQQAAITFVDWEPAFDKRLDNQKAKIAEIQLEKQNAEKEYYATQAKIQEGERLKATEQKRLETEQIKSTMAAETSAKTAEWKAVEELNLLKAAKTAAERVNVESEAKANQNRKLVSAGLTPQERAEWEYKTKVGVAEQLKELQMPSTVIIGADGKSGDGLLSTLIGAQIAGGMTTNKP